ncbi:MAG: hypothetical protein AMJ60_09435 [Desulfobacterales bacterium SG8_35]|nr:MAG: hypothetical protein AMJ60_09435 [Desulfobacterales bacterium SG8_35]
MRKQGLLKKLDECVYPAEFLVARLRGKKGGLFRNWEFLLAGSDAVAHLQNTPFYPYLRKYGPPGIWRFLRQEHLWVYKRMNNNLRVLFRSYFVLHEITTLLVCLRYLSGGKEKERVAQELQDSLLHDDIQDILTGSLDFPVMLQALESRLSSFADTFKGLADHYESKGIAALEIFIRNCLWAAIFSQKQPSLLRAFLQYQVDYYNCLALAKTLRWQIEAEPAMISGGSVPLERLKQAYFRRDLTPVLNFLHIRNTDAAASSIQKLETALLGFISEKLKYWSLQRTVAGEILFYLWEQYRYTRNISMVLTTSQVDDEPVRESIVT